MDQKSKILVPVMEPVCVGEQHRSNNFTDCGTLGGTNNWPNTIVVDGPPLSKLYG
ncbi:hypothetical protein [Nitrosospira multiformis]|uniref:hypothetical protein n=1 Tax=Nitrosospira multiformis TaxID=1231 RepID=UPI0015A2504A|nr:hypothetical protein [Nitrosospira multiformis]